MAREVFDALSFGYYGNVIFFLKLADALDDVVTFGLDQHGQGTTADCGVRPKHHEEVREAIDGHCEVGLWEGSETLLT